MLTKKVVVALVVALAFGAAIVRAAEAEVTLTGTVSCAMCTLKKADAKACQDVFVASGDQAGEYYLVKNAVSEKFGHVCKGSRTAKATGTVTEKDGRKWLTVSTMEPVTN